MKVVPYAFFQCHLIGNIIPYKILDLFFKNPETWSYNNSFFFGWMFMNQFFFVCVPVFNRYSVYSKCVDFFCLIDQKCHCR